MKAAQRLGARRTARAMKRAQRKRKPSAASLVRKFVLRGALPGPARIFSVYKVSEGGMGQRAAIALLADRGIAAERAYSPFVGQTAVFVLSNSKRVLRRASRILYGKL